MMNGHPPTDTVGAWVLTFGVVVDYYSMIFGGIKNTSQGTTERGGAIFCCLPLLPCIIVLTKMGGL